MGARVRVRARTREGERAGRRKGWAWGRGQDRCWLGSIWCIRLGSIWCIIRLGSIWCIRSRTLLGCVSRAHCLYAPPCTARTVTVQYGTVRDPPAHHPTTPTKPLPALAEALRGGGDGGAGGGGHWYEASCAAHSRAGRSSRQLPRLTVTSCRCAPQQQLGDQVHFVLQRVGCKKKAGSCPG